MFFEISLTQDAAQSMFLLYIDPALFCGAVTVATILVIWRRFRF